LENKIVGSLAGSEPYHLHHPRREPHNLKCSHFLRKLLLEEFLKPPEKMPLGLDLIEGVPSCSNKKTRWKQVPTRFPSFDQD
jgi:hypothetical protein